MLVNEIFSRQWRDRNAVARYAGLTGSPDESEKRRRERGLARADTVRVRCGMIQFAWRFVRFQKDSALAQSFAARTADGRASNYLTASPPTQSGKKSISDRHSALAWFSAKSSWR